MIDEEEESEAAPAEKPSIFLTMMVLVTAVTGFLMGYDLCIVAVVLGPIRDHFGVCAGPVGEGLSEARPCIMNELFVAILAPGAMVSSLAGGWAADKFGRRAVLVASDIFFAGAATMMAMSQTYTVSHAERGKERGYSCLLQGMLVGRSLLGVGIGMGFVVFPTYMAEVSPADVRGILVTCQEVAQCIGCLTAYAVAYLVNPIHHWRWLLLAAGIPAVLQLLGTVLLPESPRWLVSHKKVRKARIALERIAGQRPICGGTKDDDTQTESRNAIVDSLLQADMSCVSGSDMSRLSRVRATKMLLSEADEMGRPLDQLNLDLELRSAMINMNSRSPSRMSLEVPTEAVAPTKRQPPLQTLLDLMEEQELRDEAKQRRREEKQRRYAEEFEAARNEGTLTTHRRLKFLGSKIVNYEGFSGLRRLLSFKKSLFVACGCAISQNFTGANTILYYSVDLMRMGDICDPLFTGVMIGVVKVGALQTCNLIHFVYPRIQLAGVTLMLLYLEKVGRRLPLIVGTTGTLLCHIGLAVSDCSMQTLHVTSLSQITFKFASFEGCPAFSEEGADLAKFPTTPQSTAVMCLLWGLMFCWNISWAGLMFVVASEVLPSSIRGTGMGVTIATFWILSFAFQLAFRLLVLAMTATGRRLRVTLHYFVSRL